jgi:hypothetical protein
MPQQWRGVRSEAAGTLNVLAPLAKAQIRGICRLGFLLGFRVAVGQSRLAYFADPTIDSLHTNKSFSLEAASFSFFQRQATAEAWSKSENDAHS